jgi:serine/threonine protein kinase
MWTKRAFQIGEVLRDPRTGRNYRIEGFLDQGAYSEVYVALCLETNVRYAVKALKPKHSSDPVALERHVREGEALYRLKHPNVVRVYFIGKRDEDGLIFMVMDLLVGANLQKRIASLGGRIPVPWLLEIAIGLCDGLEAIHELAVHRDIKPANLHVADDGWASMYDLGAAKYPKKGRLTTGGFTIGTVEYMSPEQLNKPETIDARSDLYSFGVVLYEALSGVHPMSVWNGDTGTYELSDDMIQLGTQIMLRPAMPLRELAPFVPDYVADTIHRLLEKKPEKRIRTAAGLSELLARGLDRFRFEHQDPAPLPLSMIGAHAAEAVGGESAVDPSGVLAASPNPFITISVVPPEWADRGAKVSKAGLPFASTEQVPTAMFAAVALAAEQESNETTFDSGKRSTFLPGELENDPLWLADDEDQGDVSGERPIDTELDEADIVEDDEYELVEDDEVEIVDRLRRQSRNAENTRRKAISSEPLLARAPSPAPAVAAIASEHPEPQIQADLLNRMLARLPEPMRIAFILVGIDGLSLDEAATRTGVLKTDIVARVVEARRRLRAMLKENVERGSAPGTEAPTTASPPPAAILASPPRAPARRTSSRADRDSARTASSMNLFLYGTPRRRAVTIVSYTALLVVVWGLLAWQLLVRYAPANRAAPASSARAVGLDRPPVHYFASSSDLAAIVSTGGQLRASPDAASPGSP